MDCDELERWLCDSETLPPHPVAVANALGLSASDLADTTLLRVAERVRSLRLTLAVLHDAFPADVDVWRWLETPRCELDGGTPRSVLATNPNLVQRLAVLAWNEASELTAYGS